jgi:predicted Ser/Thr protein kinase
MLSWLHRYPINVCPGAWPWTVTLAGAVLGLSPVVGAVLVAVLRKATGNRYGAPVLVAFGLIGAVFGFGFPWLGSTLISNVMHTAARNGSGPGLSASALLGLRQPTGCGFTGFGTQGRYLGRGHTVFEALMPTGEGTFAFVAYLVLLVGVPVLCLFAVMLQQRIAFRRGPRWPGRFMWLPFVVFGVATIPLEANLMAHLWAGFLVVSIGGLIVVALLGPPSRAVLHRPPREALPPPAPVSDRLYRQPPAPEPYRPQHQTPLSDALLKPRQPTPAPARLADTPGPLPFATGDTATVLWNSAGGRFRRVRQLGHGGFGTVWLAKDTQLDRTVALKFAHAPDADTQARMMREARALAAVHHPNCVRVYDIIEDVDGLGIVMEFIDGQPLHEVVAAGGALDDVAAARLWATMAGALSAAHAEGVLHRDVKPANVLLDPDGVPHLIDFGIARTRGDATLTATGMMMGTPDFLAPETAATGVATPASDAWQVAATVSYALTGQPPRGHRSNPMSALMAAAQRLPNTHLPERSRHHALLADALDPEPGRRPTLASVHRELSAWLAGGGHAEQGPITKVTKRAARLVPGR